MRITRASSYWSPNVVTYHNSYNSNNYPRNTLIHTDANNDGTESSVIDYFYTD